MSEILNKCMQTTKWVQLHNGKRYIKLTGTPINVFAIIQSLPYGKILINRLTFACVHSNGTM